MSSSEQIDSAEYIAQKKQELLGKVIECLRTWVSTKLAVRQVHGTQAAKTSAEVETSAPGPSGANNRTSRDTNKNLRSQRRPKDGDQSDGEPEQLRGNGNKEDETVNLKLACPYFKYDAPQYGQWTQCCGPGWETTHRVNLQRSAVTMFQNMQIQLLAEFRQARQQSTLAVPTDQSSQSAPQSGEVDNTSLAEREEPMIDANNFPLDGNDTFLDFSDPELFSLFGNPEFATDGTGFLDEILRKSAEGQEKPQRDSGYASNSGTCGTTNEI
ncbi:putative C2H2-type domain-containing protein [Seiridium cardinale]